MQFFLESEFNWIDERLLHSNLAIHGYHRECRNDIQKRF